MGRYPSVERMLDDFESRSVRHGNSDSSLPLHYEELIQFQDRFDLYIIDRSPVTCLDSYEKVLEGTGVSAGECIATCWSGINKIREGIPDHTIINFDNLLDEEYFAELHSCIIPDERFDRDRYNMLKDMRVTQDFDKLWKQQTTKKST